MGLCLTMKELAPLAGKTYRRLHDIDKLLPDDKKLFVAGEDGKCDAATFVQHWVDYNVEKAKGASEDKTLEDVKAEHEAVKMRKTELEVQRMEGELLPYGDVVQLWTELSNAIAQNMLHFAAKVAPMVAGMTSVEAVAGIIDDHMRVLMNNIADTPLPDYVTGRGETADKEGD